MSLLSEKYIKETKKENIHNVIFEIALDSGVKKIGYFTGLEKLQELEGLYIPYFANGDYLSDGSIDALGSNIEEPVTYKDFLNVIPSLTSASSLQNKIDVEKGYTTGGRITFTVSGRDIIKDLISNNYLMNRVVTRFDGFITDDFTFSDYATTYKGRIIDWVRKGDDLTVTVADELEYGKKKIPQSTTVADSLQYVNENPVDIMLDLLTSHLQIDSTEIDTTTFESERDQWMPTVTFNRVIYKPTEITKLLNELQLETNSFIFHDGEKITFKVFAPPKPSDETISWIDREVILSDSLSQKSGYENNFYNDIYFYYDWDLNGSDYNNFDNAVNALDVSSQSASQWNKESIKDIKSKWIRSLTWTSSVNSNVLITALSFSNATGSGTLDVDSVSVPPMLKWKAPNSSVYGEAVQITKEGIFTLYDSDLSKWIKVIANPDSISSSNELIYITSVPISGFVSQYCNRFLNRYRDPVSKLSFEIDLNRAVFNDKFLKAADLINLTTDEASAFTFKEFNDKNFMITSVRPDYKKSTIYIEAIETRINKRTAYIAPSGQPDYDSATEDERKYAYIGRSSDNKVFDNTYWKEGFYVY